MLIETIKWILDPFDWPRELYEDIKHWYILKKTCQEPGVQKLFKDNKPEIRYDKLYRLYTVINIPSELYDPQYENQRQTYLIEELRKIETLTLRLGISEILYPEFKLITDVPESFAYLLTLETSKDSLEIKNILLWILNIIILSGLFIFVNSILVQNTGQTLFQWIKNLI